MTGEVIPIAALDGGRLDLSDAQLITLCACGDRAAPEVLFRRFYKDVHRFLARITREERWEIDDMVQDTFVQIFKSAARYNGKSSVRTWLLGVAANVAKNHIRRKSRMRRKMKALKLEPAPEIAGPSRLAGRREELRQVERAMSLLDHDHLVVFVMCAVEGIPGTEAAKLLGLRNGTLWRRLHEARKQIAEEIKGGAR